MRIVGRGGTVDGVAAGVCGHGHDAHAVGEAAIDRLQVLVVEGLGEQDGGDGLDELGVGEEAVGSFVGGDAREGVGLVFAAQAEDEMRDGLTEQRVFGGAGRLEPGQLRCALVFELCGLGQEAVALGMEDGTHVGLGDGGDGAQDALFTAAGAGSVTGDKRVVVGAHHEHVAQRSGFGVGGVGGVEEAEVLLRGVGEQIEEAGAGHVLGIDLFGLRHHLKRVVVAASRDAGHATLAEI